MFCFLFYFSHFSFEVAVGVNGAVWIKASKTIDIIVIRNAIVNVNQASFSEAECEALVDALAGMAKQKISL